MVNNSYTERWTVKCAGGLSGDTIGIADLSGTPNDVLVRMERFDGSIQITRLTASSPAFVVVATVDAMDVMRSYTMLGIKYILTGIDHLLFVLALLINYNKFSSNNFLELSGANWNYSYSQMRSICYHFCYL